MEDISFQQVFSRVYSYLCEAGVEMNSTQCRQLLQLMDDAVAGIGTNPEQKEGVGKLSGTPAPDSRGHRLLESAMNRVPDYFTLPESHIAVPTPALCRGSIGYRRHD
ncbi:hypothetical protein [Marinobacter piscensis]|uniref:hypothetical protein n=1 Tax=Marinobacter piscensis TaxID=1562308 RepID=UPI00119DAAC5|nr:hypothetical protein [Marinobacter piscensis]